MSFKFFSTKIEVSFLFFAMLTTVILCDKTGYAPLMLFSALLHEAGHLIAMKICGCTPTKIRLVPASIEISSPPLILKNEIFVQVCGPLINFFVFILLFCCCSIFKNDLLLSFAVINLLYSLFNMLPVNGLDGGDVLREILIFRLGSIKAEKIMKILSMAFGFAAFIIALIMTAMGNLNYSAYIMAFYLILSVLIKL
ncbi:MAG: hypothetical protein E7568_00780 [Ruminococcaceae bacterium]|nr:hypothetical protein [Oscillospiraceae bacterium]